MSAGIQEETDLPSLIPSERSLLKPRRGEETPQRPRDDAVTKSGLGLSPDFASGPDPSLG